LQERTTLDGPFGKAAITAGLCNGGLPQRTHEYLVGRTSEPCRNPGAPTDRLKPIASPFPNW